jgi:RNA 3'-terminal phosphate cyclase (ATP)
VLEIDGSEKSGSGTIVRVALGLAALVGREVRVVNIRAQRPNPGLRRQHVAAARALAELCGGSLEGDAVGSQALTFRPGRAVRGGRYHWDIGSAGSTIMMAMSLLPLACFADTTCRFRIQGGLFQDFAPSAFHMQRVLLPTLFLMGVRAELHIERPGYVPAGGGVVEVTVRPVRRALAPLVIPQRRGRVKAIRGVALSSHLEGRQVSRRMAESCAALLAQRGLRPEIDVLNDDTAAQAGAALAVVAETKDGLLLGADRAGAPRRTSEAIGRSVAQALLADLDSGASVDRHLSDQLVVFAALASGESHYSVPRVSEHLETNLWLAETVAGAHTAIEGDLVRVEGIGHERRG